MLPAHFHPAVATWFSTTLGAPTECQTRAWESIADGHPTLVCAPTGSGKTLAAFLHGLNDLIERSRAGPLPDETDIIYVSPLKALGNDIQKNLEQPLRAIDARLADLVGEVAGRADPEKSESGTPPALTSASGIRTQVRTGDTPPAARQAMRRHPPHILVTTPESLFILLTSEGGREMLGSARTVIVDEIHALASTKRGAHLALSLERLDALAGRPLQRIGLSATQRPIESIAAFLTGAGRVARIVDEGHHRERDLGLLLPRSPLEAVMSAEVWEELYGAISAEISAHRTTLVFTNTRRLAERLARHLGEHLGALGDTSLGAPTDGLVDDATDDLAGDGQDGLPGEIPGEMPGGMPGEIPDGSAPADVAKLGPDVIVAHHGSLSRELRLAAEERLKRGQLRALVATASLELGIDIGEVDLVIQIGSPRSIGTLLQRVGRSGHGIARVPKGRLVPLSRDDLVECVALLGEVRRGNLDHIGPCPASLDVLAQHLVSAAASESWSEDDLFALTTRAHPYRALARDAFDAVVTMLSDGFATRRGRRAAYLHRDAVNQVVRARKHARLTALTAGGAIPEMADYNVILEPTETTIGTLNEDFAIESLPGDVFVLGTHSWRILRVEPGKVRVEDAKGQPPSLPFWLGEAPARSDELSRAVSELRARANDWLDALDANAPPGAAALTPGASTGRSDPGPDLAPDGEIGSADRVGPSIGGDPLSATVATLSQYLGEAEQLDPAAATQLAAYLFSTYRALGRIPTAQMPCVERFFDEAGGMQLVIHAPYGARINRAWGLALRKRFCRRFNFELQAAATDDSIVLSLGETHSFALSDVGKMLRPETAREVLEQAVLASPMFTARWRWNANISLAVPRFFGGKKVPPPIQRMQAEDLIAVVFPDQLACAENLAGEREVPDHPLVKQTLDDALHEAMDLAGLRHHLEALRDTRRRLRTIDSTTPSPLAAEILNAKPYAFLDDAPLEERRTQAVMSRRWLDPATAEDIGRLDAHAIERVRAEAAPRLADPEEIHDALLCLGVMTPQELGPADLEPLVTTGRAVRFDVGDEVRWCATERAGELLAIYPLAERYPNQPLPERFAEPRASEDAVRELLRSRLEHAGPITATALGHILGVSLSQIAVALATLEAEGFALRGHYEPVSGEEQWCERRLLARIHRYTLARLRQDVQPVSAADFMRFLFRWHGLDSGSQRAGPEGLEHVLAQLEGFCVPADSWERDLLPPRMAHYRAEWLDALCLSGQATWLRRHHANPARGAKAALVLVAREHLELWALGEEDTEARLATCSPIGRRVYEGLGARGACFFTELMEATGLARFQLEDALGELVGAGLTSADGFAGLRGLIAPARRRARAANLRKPQVVAVRPEYRHVGIGFAPPRRTRHDGGGRWTALGRQCLTACDAPTRERHIELTAATLLRRYGVVFKRLLEREATDVSWRELAMFYRRLEARGEIRSGRFVNRFSGEQFAHPDAVAMLRAVRRQAEPDALISISALDPLNLVGILTPGERIPARASNRVLFRGGVPVAAELGDELRPLVDDPPPTGGLGWESIERLRRRTARR